MGPVPSQQDLPRPVWDAIRDILLCTNLRPSAIHCVARATCPGFLESGDMHKRSSRVQQDHGGTGYERLHTDTTNPGKQGLSV